MLVAFMACTLAALAGSWCIAAQPADSDPQALDLSTLRGSAKVNALIATVADRQRELRSMRARFTQTKSSSMLLEETESTGELSYLAPDLVRWDFSRPDSMVIVVSQDMVTTFHPDVGRAQRVKISQNHRKLVGVFAGTQSLDELKAHFRITLSDAGGSEPYRLTLNPIHRAVKKRLQHVLIEVDRALLLPVVVEYHETDGDNTRYEFSGMELNPALEAASFRLELGEDVEVETIDATSGAG